MEGSTKTKIAAGVAIVIVALPIWFFSDGSMEARVNEAWEKAGGRPSAPYRDGRVKDPEMAERLYKLAYIYRVTFRGDTDQYRDLLHDWILRYGGDDTDWQPIVTAGTWPGKLISWEFPYWNEDTKPRPDYYPKTPHPLTPKVLAMYADYWEKKRLYNNSRPIWELIANHFTSDPDMNKTAEKAITRDRTRTF